jgi:predicted pyridoxine 5'-phosphate oxidase superfamily flavin-nucleotide-binding protein
MAEFFERLESKHVEFIAQQKLSFVATAAEGAHPNVSPKGYDSLAVLAPDHLAFVDLPGSGNQTATHVAEHGRITLMFCSFERTSLILRVYGSDTLRRYHERKHADPAVDWKTYVDARTARQPPVVR